eukprot:TRINITY_DN5441_c1_g1_i1.p1 TRINITY_DN5441_c1_g1~~TRINITY_DN5441_c1_g1_i1.p1  ORF type:complete len:865 (-),score=327.79 TRINITY_DN5441_c1_g1_i1:195-2462(-)
MPDPRGEELSATALRWLQFLVRTLNFQPSFVSGATSASGTTGGGRSHVVSYGMESDGENESASRQPGEWIPAFKEQLIRGNRNAFYQIMYFVFSKFDDHKKREYLARFLMPLEIPEEMQSDEEIRLLVEQYRELQEEFKEVHRVVDRNRQTKVSPAELRAKIQQFEKDKDQLEHRLRRLKDKVEGEYLRGEATEADRRKQQSILEAARSLRLEYDEEMKLQMSFREQERRIAHAEEAHRLALISFRDISELTQAHDGGGLDIQGLISHIEGANREKLRRVRTLIPSEIERTQKVLKTLEQIENDPPNVATLESQVRMLEEECHRKEQSRETTTVSVPTDDDSKRDEKIVMFQKQLRIVQQKRKELEDERERGLRELEAVKRRGKQQQQQQQQQPKPVIGGSGGDAEEEVVDDDDVDGMGDGVGHKKSHVGKGDDESDVSAKAEKLALAMTKEEFHRLAQSIRSKNTTYKRLKSQLGEYQAELDTLRRTESIVQERLAHVKAKVRSLASERGVDGFQETQESIEEVSAEKGAVDMEKGKTLEEISKLVTEINETVQQKKNELAPEIVKLRALRDEHKRVEAKHEEMRDTFQSVMTGLESELAMAEQDVIALREDCRRQETLYHLIQTQTRVLEILQKRVNDEKRHLSSRSGETGEKVRLSEAFAAYEDAFQDRLTQLQAMSRDLQEKQKYIKENQEPLLRQRKYFRSLKKILEAKEKALDVSLEEMGHSTRAPRGGPMDLVDMAQAAISGVDRLVL